jgi:ubiquinone/menaquinone biosynthesis C-methylase UbiE
MLDQPKTPNALASVQKLFDQLADRYEEGFKWSLGSMYVDQLEKKLLLNNLRNYITGALLLDLGVGFGRLSKEFLKLGAEVIGVDVSFTMCKKAKLNLSSPNFHVVQASLEYLPIRNKHINIVNCFRTLKYTNYLAVLNEVNRVLRDEGILSVEIQNKLWPFLLLKKFNRGKLKNQIQITLFIPSYFLRELRAMSYKLLNCTELTILPYHLYYKVKKRSILKVIILLENLLSKLLPRQVFSRNLLVIVIRLPSKTKKIYI